MKTITLTAPAKATKDCFTDFYRDPSLDTLLPKEQPAQSGDITTIKLNKEQTFLEMAQEYLGTTDPKKIEKHCLTLPMVEKIIAEYPNELHTNGRLNFFFVKSKDGVSVVDAARGYQRWGAVVYRLKDSYHWRVGDIFLVRNLGHSESSDSLSLESRVAELEAWRERMAKWLNKIDDIQS